jgi:exosome complex RNA-binding protein Rrp42 (RNase PH superfamily)
VTRIGAAAIVDATLEEEQCSNGRVAFAVNGKGNVCTTQKGNGVLSVSQLQQMMLVRSRLVFSY